MSRLLKLINLWNKGNKRLFKHHRVLFFTAVFLTAKNRGKTGVFREVRRGFPEVKPEIQTAIPPRQYRGKCTNTFERYCKMLITIGAERVKEESSSQWLECSASRWVPIILGWYKTWTPLPLWTPIWNLSFLAPLFFLKNKIKSCRECKIFFVTNKVQNQINSCNVL